MKGFRFLEYGSSDPVELSASCSGTWDTYDLAANRLIGFRVEATDESIKAVQPIVDCPDCSETELVAPSSLSMQLYVGGGSTTQ